MKVFFADLHIHIGRDQNGKSVKITGSKSLTLTNILKESSRVKGLELIGVIDCHVPAVQAEIDTLLARGHARELLDGGIRFEQVTLLLGSEIEIYDDQCKGPIHVLCFLPTLKQMKVFTNWLSERMTNITLSSQRYYGTGKELQYKVKELGGLFIPAHVFTPYKSLFGKGVTASVKEVFDPDLIDAIELGLSSDTSMADKISELHRYSFLTNSDAHSLPKIAREYQKLMMQDATFKELEWTLHHVNGRKIVENYGMNPLLGKYYTTVCKKCEKSRQDCLCPTKSWIKGVADRITELADGVQAPSDRPRYIHQVPLEYIPTLGPKTYQRLIDHFKTEMNVIHRASEQEISGVSGEKIAKAIVAMRKGILPIAAGGGGKYGKVTDD
ncbi:endonuclease Q family protein [Aquibacillus salsiterrae]|uniref:Endonuclease Q family protein n=1 Tax=Aquibacillus salsiterrae TaxID=2950439 RepID=A0A9X3WCJ2_9BACI|nr:endonuclease Q family protein [Aquibacillus salsiterrae]MDC3415440.1 endonuclease Q family protein [Aquibacillus salsiterrae]